MNTHADKTQENKSQSVSIDHSQIQSDGETTFQFVDNRPEAIAQRKLQEMANNSPQVSQLRAFQDMANNGPQAKQSAQLQAIANSHSAQQQQTIQLATNLTLNGATSPVAMSMTSVLDPKAPPAYGQGSSADSDLDAIMNTLPTDPQQGNTKKFIKGHLLNDNFGGMANGNNLFPITAEANSNHKNKVENKIWNYLEGGVGDPINYSVNVTDSSVVTKRMKPKKKGGVYADIETPKATFSCTTTGGSGFTNLNEPIKSEAENT